MFVKRRKALILKVLVVFLCFTMANTGFSAGAGSGRIIPKGKVSIIKDDKVIGEFSQEAPLPEGSLLRCEAECAVRLDDVYMVAEPDTVFSLKSALNLHELYVQEGTVYYVLSKSSRQLKFRTPAGDVTTKDVTVFDSEVRGYVRASERKSEIGVIKGGSIVLVTPSGDLTVTPGNAVTAGGGAMGMSVAETEGTGGLTTNQKWGLAAAGAGVVAGGIAIFALSGGDGNGNDGSPSSP